MERHPLQMKETLSASASCLGALCFLKERKIKISYNRRESGKM
jgi:hypothetical protein